MGGKGARKRRDERRIKGIPFEPAKRLTKAERMQELRARYWDEALNYKKKENDAEV